MSVSLQGISIGQVPMIGLSQNYTTFRVNNISWEYGRIDPPVQHCSQSRAMERQTRINISRFMRFNRFTQRRGFLNKNKNSSEWQPPVVKIGIWRWYGGALQYCLLLASCPLLLYTTLISVPITFPSTFPFLPPLFCFSYFFLCHPIPVFSLHSLYSLLSSRLPVPSNAPALPNRFAGFWRLVLEKFLFANMNLLTCMFKHRLNIKQKNIRAPEFVHGTILKT